MQGYLHPHYTQSLSEFGQAIELKQCEGWLLKQPILGTVFMM